MWAAWESFCQAKVGVGRDAAMRAYCPTIADMMRELATKYPEVTPPEDKRAEHVGGWKGRGEAVCVRSTGLCHC